MPEVLRQIRSYLPEPLQQIRTYFPDTFLSYTVPKVLYRPITSSIILNGIVRSCKTYHHLHLTFERGLGRLYLICRLRNWPPPSPPKTPQLTVSFREGELKSYKGSRFACRLTLCIGGLSRAISKSKAVPSWTFLLTLLYGYAKTSRILQDYFWTTSKIF